MADLQGMGSGAEGTRPRRRIGIISLSIIADDPRVRRQGDMLAAAGWEVVAIGLPGARSHPPAWRCVEIGPLRAVPSKPDRPDDFASGGQSPLRQAIMRARSLGVRAARKIVRTPVAALRLAAAIFSNFLHRLTGGHIRRVLRPLRVIVEPAFAERLYWALNDKFQRLFDAAQHESVDLWLANDWTSLPAVRKIAATQGVPFAYDTHELSIDEYAQHWSWRFAQRPVIAAIERLGIRNAAYVSCVSDGIAERIMQFYRMPRAPLVIRNVPRYEECAFRPTGDRIRVLYHGIVSPGRSLEACIESVRDWRPEFDFTIRGSGGADYIAQLTRLAQDRGVADRVTFAAAVPMVDLVRSATAYDIGLCVLPSHSLQNVYALPNKFFEYIMAGLALCVIDLPEMSRIVKARRIGQLIEHATPDAITASINRFDRNSIDNYKRNALAAARELNWETEGRKLLAACDGAVAGLRKT